MSVGRVPHCRLRAQDIEKKEEELKQRQDASALQIEKAMAQDLKDEPPPKMPSERDMKNPQKMQEYMLQVRASLHGGMAGLQGLSLRHYTSC